MVTRIFAHMYPKRFYVLSHNAQFRVYHRKHILYHHSIHPRFTSPTFHAALYPQDAIVCVLMHTRVHAPLHRHEQATRLLRRCVGNPYYLNLPLRSGWMGVVGCVYEATGPKLKGILPCQWNGDRGEGMQQSLTSERPYQRVILLVDAGVATSRRHWFARNPRGVAMPVWWGRRIPGNDYQKATRSRTAAEIQHGGDPATLKDRRLSPTTLSYRHHNDTRRCVALLPIARARSRGSRSICTRT